MNITIAAGGAHFIGLQSNGKALGRGNNYFLQSNCSVDKFVMVASGYGHAIGLTRDGTAIGWDLMTFVKLIVQKVQKINLLL